MPRLGIRSRLCQILLERARLEPQIRRPGVVHQAAVLGWCGYEQTAEMVVIAHQIGELAVQARIIQLRQTMLAEHVVQAATQLLIHLL